MDLLNDALPDIWVDEDETPEDLDPQVLANEPGLTAEERGWVSGKDLDRAVAEVKALKKLATPGQQKEIMAHYQRGTAPAAIAFLVRLPVTAVNQVVEWHLRSIRHGMTGAQERERQFVITSAIIDRLMTRALPEPDADGHIPPTDIRTVETLLKFLSRRAALVGADAPSKLAIEAEITHVPGEDVVNKVAEYMDLADRLMEFGYGSGRVPEGQEIIDAEIVDPRDLPPPLPPVGPWPVVQDEGDLVEQSAREERIARARELDARELDAMELNEQPGLRALRLPKPSALGPRRAPSWAVDPHE